MTAHMSTGKRDRTFLRVYFIGLGKIQGRKGKDRKTFPLSFPGIYTLQYMVICMWTPDLHRPSTNCCNKV